MKREYEPVVKLSAFINDLKAQGIEHFYIHHPSITGTMDITQIDKFINDRPNQYVKVIYQDLGTDNKSIYLYLSIEPYRMRY